MSMLLLAQPNGEPFTYGGRVLLHDNRPEAEFLLQGCRLIQVAGNSPEEVATRYGFRTMLLKDHPGMVNVRFPLERKDFL